MVNPLKLNQMIGQIVILIKVHCNINRDYFLVLSRYFLLLLLTALLKPDNVYLYINKDRQQRKVAD